MHAVRDRARHRQAELAGLDVALLGRHRRVGQTETGGVVAGGGRREGLPAGLIQVELIKADEARVTGEDALFAFGIDLAAQVRHHEGGVLIDRGPVITRRPHRTEDRRGRKCLPWGCQTKPGRQMMVPQSSLLVALVDLIDVIPSRRRGRAARGGRPPVYSDRLFFKALVIMMVRTSRRSTGCSRSWTSRPPRCRRCAARLTEQRALPERGGPGSGGWRAARAPCRPRSAAWGGTWSRCSSRGRDCGRAVAIDSTVLRARGGVWHKKDREAGVVPHTSIDTEAHWTKSGWHGWVYGWKLHLVTTVAAVWIPLAAELTPANAADNEAAPRLLADLPAEVRFVLGDTALQRPGRTRPCCGDRPRPGRHPARRLPAHRRRRRGPPRLPQAALAPPSRTSTSSSRASSTPTARSPPAASSPPSASPSAPSSSTN